MKLIINFLTVLSILKLGSAEDEKTCGYDSCRKVDSSTINVHIVAHSHNDVGWLKTVDQYYYGSYRRVQDAAVQYIISSVVEALRQNPQRRFIQVETAYFDRWWNDQNEETKKIVRKLVNNGQLEMTGGGWSMNDEAVTNYQSIIDQFTYGLGVLDDMFGECGRPRVGWQIDSFGHSREMASIFAQMGFDGLFLGRVDFREKEVRFRSKTGEMIWRGSANLGEQTNIFTSILPNRYSAPDSFCFDGSCDDGPIVDDEESPEYNYARMVQQFAEHISSQAESYKTNNLIFTMGDDFHYQNAFRHYSNLDKLIKGFEYFDPQVTPDNKSVSIFYSTPACYLKAIYEESLEKGHAFPLKTDDFLPYATDFHKYWTGFYTSRPTSKRFERLSNNLLQVAKQLLALNSGEYGQLQKLQEAMGIMQHHDAITGTEKQHVADDYHRILHAAVVATIGDTSEVIKNLLKADRSAEQLNFQSCLLANVSYCEESNLKQFVVAIYNPLSRRVSHYVHLPVPSTQFTIFGPEDEQLEYQISPSPRNFSYTELNTSEYSLVFLAEDLPPLGMKVYQIRNLDPEDKNPSLELDISEKRFHLGDDTHGIQIDPSTGKLQSITLNNRTIEVEQELMFYRTFEVTLNTTENTTESTTENVMTEDDDASFSGAYAFRPEVQFPFSITNESIPTTTYRGVLFEEVHQHYTDWATQIIRVYKKERNFVEFDWIVGPLPAGKEIISRFSTKLDSGDVFYTDSNGRETLKRIRDYRPTYSYTDEEPVSGNYYPITSKIVITDKDKNLQFAVLNDRAQGGTSANSGQVELMLHRRCVHDDGYGVNEVLDEEEFYMGLVARGQHYVTFGPVNSSEKTAAAVERDIAQRKLLAPWVFLADAKGRDSLREQMTFEYDGLSASLPDNVQILTLEPWKDGTVLVRLEHVLEVGEDPDLSKEVTVDLKALFNDFAIESLRETTLAANQWLDDKNRLQFTVSEELTNPAEEAKDRRYHFEEKDVGNHKDRSKDSLWEITLAPMEIRTFVATVDYNLKP